MNQLEEKKKAKKNFGKKKRRTRLSRIKFQQKILEIKRVVKVVKGGKILNFRAVVIVGDGNGKVSVGVGRAQEVAKAIEKAIMYGKKRLIVVPLTQDASIPHVMYSSCGSSRVMLRPASQGTGVIAGGSVRAVLELAGIRNILAKQYGSNNLLNNAKATILGLRLLRRTIEVRGFLSNENKKYYSSIMVIEKLKKKANLFNKLRRIKLLTFRRILEKKKAKSKKN